MVTVLSWGLLSRRFGYRILWGTLAMAIATFGAILIFALSLRLRVGRLMGFYLIKAFPGGEVVMLSLISSNVAG